MVDKKLLEKVQKLLNLSASSNEHEAALALSKAAELMAEYGITKTALDRTQITRDEVKSTQSVSKVKDWELMLMQLVAKSFGCKLLWKPGVSWMRPDYWGRHVFIGHKDQVQLAVYAATVLLRQLTKARLKFSQDLAYRGYTRSPAMTAQLDGFCKGWIATIRAKVHAFANSPELDKIIDEYILEISKGRMSKVDNRGHGALGHEVGASAALDVDLHRPMNHDKKRQLK